MTEIVNNALEQTGYTVFRVVDVLDTVELGDNTISYLCSVKNTFTFTPEEFYHQDKLFNYDDKNDNNGTICKYCIKLPNYFPSWIESRFSLYNIKVESESKFSLYPGNCGPFYYNLDNLGALMSYEAIKPSADSYGFDTHCNFHYKSILYGTRSGIEQTYLITEDVLDLEKEITVNFYDYRVIRITDKIYAQPVVSF